MANSTATKSPTAGEMEGIFQAKKRSTPLSRNTVNAVMMINDALTMRQMNFRTFTAASRNNGRLM